MEQVQLSIKQNWITSYTQDDIDYVLSHFGKMPDKEICRELNITELTLKEIIRVNKQSKHSK